MQATIYFNHIAAGILEKTDGRYRFQYQAEYLANPDLPAISLTLAKRTEPYESDRLFPFFYGLLAEGVNKTIQCRELKVDEADHFSRLLKTLDEDSIGAITLKVMTA